MKKLILIFAFATVLSACTKNSVEPDDNTSSGSKVTGTMKGTLDGKAWEAKSMSFGGLSAYIDITGKVDEVNLISIQFVDTKLEINKSYSLNPLESKENLSATGICRINNEALVAESGTFKITKYTKNKEIQGEINAEFTNFVDKKASLKNCTFSMKY
jgi:hypothetical protein